MLVCVEYAAAVILGIGQRNELRAEVKALKAELAGASEAQQVRSQG